MNAIAIILFGLHVTTSFSPGANSIQNERMRPPLESEIKRGIEKMKLVYEADYKKINEFADEAKKQKNIKYVLARKMMEDVQQVKPSEDIFFPMISEVVRLSTDANRPKTGLVAIRILERHYSVNSSRIRLEVLNKSISNNTRLDEIKAAAAELKHSIQVAVLSDQLDEAKQLALIGKSLAKQVRSKPLQTEISQSAKIVDDLKKQDSEFGLSQKRIKEKNATQNDFVLVSLYLGLRKGNWNDAEIVARRIEDEGLREVFIRESLNDDSLESTIQLCKDWSSFKSEKSALFDLQASELAAFRFSLIYERLDGFEQQYAEAKIEEVRRNPILTRNWDYSNYGKLASLGFTWNVTDSGKTLTPKVNPAKVRNAKLVHIKNGQWKKFKVGAPVFIDDNTIKWKNIPKGFENAVYSSAPKHIGKNRIQIKDEGKVFLLIHASWGGGGSGGPWQKELTTEKEFSKQGWKKGESVFVYGKTPEHTDRFETWSKICKRNEIIHIRTHKYIAPIVSFPIAAK